MREIAEFWPNISFLLGGGVLGFFIRSFIELRNKKNEIRFSKLHENKILEIKSFYKSYQLLRVALQQLHFQIQFREHNQEVFKKLGRNIARKFVIFEYNLMTVRLFIDNKDIAIVEDIKKSLSQVDTDLQMTLVELKFPLANDLPDKMEAVWAVFDKTLPSLINKIELNLRESFK